MRQFFGIKVGSFRWGLDNRTFSADKPARVIHPSLSCAKGIGAEVGQTLLDLYSRGDLTTFPDALGAIKAKGSGINSKVLGILAEIGYFSPFASVNKVKRFMKASELFFGKKQLKKESVPQEYLELVKQFGIETNKTVKNLDSIGLLRAIFESIPDGEDSPLDLAVSEIKHLGDASVSEDYLKGYVIVTSLDTTFSPRIQYYSLRFGTYQEAKIPKKQFNFNKFGVLDVLKIVRSETKAKQAKTEKGFVPIEGSKELWITEYDVVRTNSEQGRG
jgi:hypothetical protein